MTTAAIEMHETMIRLAKGIVRARERHGARPVPSPIAGVLAPSPFAGLLDRPTGELKASLGVWENWLKLERSKAPA